MNSIPWFLQRVFDYLSQDLLRRVEIRHRPAAAFIPLSPLPTCILASTSYVNSIAVTKDNVEIFSKEVIKQVSRNIELCMRQIETKSNLLVLSNRVQGAPAKVASGNSKE